MVRSIYWSIIYLYFSDIFVGHSRLLLSVFPLLGWPGWAPTFPQLLGQTLFGSYHPQGFLVLINFFNLVCKRIISVKKKKKKKTDVVQFMWTRV